MPKIIVSVKISANIAFIDFMSILFLIVPHSTFIYVYLYVYAFSSGMISYLMLFNIVLLNIAAVNIISIFASNNCDIFE